MFNDDDDRLMSWIHEVYATDALASHARAEALLVTSDDDGGVQVTAATKSEITKLARGAGCSDSEIASIAAPPEDDLRPVLFVHEGEPCVGFAARTNVTDIREAQEARSRAGSIAIAEQDPEGIVDAMGLLLALLDATLDDVGEGLATGNLAFVGQALTNARAARTALIHGP